VDTGAKLIGYFRLPSVRHYLVIDVTRWLSINPEVATQIGGAPSDTASLRRGTRGTVSVVARF
jgi:hypothetical protein